MPALFDSPRDRAEFRRPAQRAGVELYRAWIVDCAFEPHSHDAYGIGVIDCGVERFRLRGTEHLAASGSLVVMNPQDLHTGRAETPEGWSYRMIYLDERLLQDLTGAPAWRFDEAVFVRPDMVAGVSRLLQGLWQATTMPDAALAVDGLLLELAERLRPLTRTGGNARERAVDQRFTAVLDFMHAHLDQPLTLDVLAGIAGLSPFHFLRSFRASHHATPQQMLMALRLLDAKRQLAAGESIAQIAAAVGLTDQAHLTRAFARRYGVTPARYQQQLGTRPDHMR